MRNYASSPKIIMRREQPGHTLQTTALVNEAYLRLVDWKNVRWQNRSHFYAVSAQMMRRILVDYARSRPLIKRDGGIRQVTLNEAALIPHEQPTDLIALDDALNSLAIIDARKSKIVELRFFGGLSVEEAAEVLKVSPVTVMREWSKAKHGSTGNSRRPWITEQDKARSYPSPIALGSPLIYGTRPLAGNRSSFRRGAGSRGGGACGVSR